MGEHKLPKILSAMPGAEKPVEGTKIPIRNRILVCTPTHSGNVSHEMALTMQIATIQCLVRGVVLEWMFISGNSLVQTARNWLSAEFLSRPEFSHILWWDDDLGAQPEGVLKLLESDKDVVGGVYLAKHQTAPFYPYMATGPVVDNLQPVQRIASGFMLIKRAAFEMMASTCDTYVMENCGQERLVPHIFEIMLTPNPKNPDENHCLGEDFLLCQRFEQNGIEMFARTDIKFSHMGRYAYIGCLGDDLKRQAEHEAANTA